MRLYWEILPMQQLEFGGGAETSIVYGVSYLRAVIFL